VRTVLAVIRYSQLTVLLLWSGCFDSGRVVSESPKALAVNPPEELADLVTRSEAIVLADVRRVEVQAENRQRVILTTGEPGELPAMLELQGETVIVERVFKTLADGTPLTHKGLLAELPVVDRSYIFFARLEDGQVKLRNEMTESTSYIESCLAHIAPADYPPDLAGRV
jgi:hypothetical protein